MDKMEEIDNLRLKLAQSLEEKARLQLRVAELERRHLLSAVSEKYAFADGDTFDPKTLEIKRAPKAEALPAKKANGKAARSEA